MVKTQIEIVPYDGMDEDFLSQIRTWVNHVLEKADPSSTPQYLRITIWKHIKDLQDFYRREKEELGVVTSEESDFLATHEAWRGYPSIHLCHEKIEGFQDSFIEGVLHHEIGHALFHGSMEFYTFKFTSRLQEVARLHGFEFNHLQQCVYFLSIAIKDQEVVQWLTKIGLGPGQKSLLGYIMSDTEEEREAWELAKHAPVTKKIAMAAFLKVLVPIEAMDLIGFEDAQSLKNQWVEAYHWLTIKEQDNLLRLSHFIMKFEGIGFQEKLEKTAYALIMEFFETRGAF